MLHPGKSRKGKADDQVDLALLEGVKRCAVPLSAAIAAHSLHQVDDDGVFENRERIVEEADISTRQTADECRIVRGQMSPLARIQLGQVGHSVLAKLCQASKLHGEITIIGQRVGSNDVGGTEC
jgi:hypothetical protein